MKTTTPTRATDGTCAAVVSVTNVVDDVGDLIEPGAFVVSLSKRIPKCCQSHDWDVPVGRTIEAAELLPGDRELPDHVAAVRGGALVVTVQFNLGTQAGRDAYDNVLFFGDTAEWSIGFVVPPGGSRIDKATGVRHIKQVDLFEYSPVLFGANPYTATLPATADKALLRAMAATAVRHHPNIESFTIARSA